MKSVIEQDWTTLTDKNNRYEGLLDEHGYPRGWGYNHQNIASKINEYYALSKDLGDIHLADIADLIEYDENNQNIDKVFNWIDDHYVGEAKNFIEYYQSLGFQSEEEYYQAMVDLNYEKALEIYSQLKGKSPYDMEKCIDGYMGEMYFYGLGTQQDKEKGLAMMENAWRNGIGLNYEKIKKVLKDYYSSND